MADVERAAPRAGPRRWPPPTACTHPPARPPTASTRSGRRAADGQSCRDDGTSSRCRSSSALAAADQRGEAALLRVVARLSRLVSSSASPALAPRRAQLQGHSGAVAIAAVGELRLQPKEAEEEEDGRRADHAQQGRRTRLTRSLLLALRSRRLAAVLLQRVGVGLLRLPRVSLAQCGADGQVQRVHCALRRKVPHSTTQRSRQTLHTQHAAQHGAA